MISGIYKIQNLITGDMYIGSTKNLNIRLTKHKSDLKRNKHHSTRLQNSYNKYGKKSFIFELVEECLQEELLINEQNYIDKCLPVFNMLKKVEQPGSFERTPEYCEAVRVRMKKLGAPANLIKSTKTANLGRKHDDAFKQKVTQNLLKRYSDPDVRKKQIAQLDSIRPRTRIKVTDVNSNVTWIFASLADAARYFNISSGRVYGYVNFKRSLEARMNKIWEKI